MTDALDTQQQRMRTVERALVNLRKVGKPNLTAAKIRSRITQLKDTWTQIESAHVALKRTISATSQASLDYFRENHYEKCEEVYLDALNEMAERLEELEPYVSPNQSFVGQPRTGLSSVISLSHLPPISLPPFDGKAEEWESFRDRFTSLIIDNQDLTDYSRLHFLTSCLKDRALECIRDIPVTADNFRVAWKALTLRYENKQRLIHVHLSALLNLPIASKESTRELLSLRDQANIAVAALNNLNRRPKELWNDNLVYMVSTKLDSVSRKAWNLRHCDEDNPPSFDDLEKFLTTRARALEEYKLSPSSATKASPKTARSPTISSSTASQAVKQNCSACQAKHAINVCPKFGSKSPSQRRKLIKKSGRCFNCMKKGHSVGECTSKFTCRLCQRKHHNMLHLDSDSLSKDESSKSTVSQPSQSAEVKENVNSLLASSPEKTRRQVLLATAWVRVGSPSGRSISVRALLDQGSEMTFITERLAQSLYAKRIRMPNRFQQ